MDGNRIDVPPIPDGSITTVMFGISTSHEIRGSSPSDRSITHGIELKGPFLGLPLESSGNCESCGAVEHAHCEGHFGFVELPTPIYHPLHVSHLKDMLSMLCLNCLNLNNSSSNARVGSCSYCPDLPPISINEVKTAGGATSLKLEVPPRTTKVQGLWRFLDKYCRHTTSSSSSSSFSFSFSSAAVRPLLPSEVLEILNKIPEDTKLRLLGKGHRVQQGYILETLPVPPNCLHVPADISADGKTWMCNDDISIPMLRKILKKVDLIKRSRSGPANFESLQIESEELQAAVSQYMLILRGNHGNQKSQWGGSGGASSAKQWPEKMRTLFLSKSSGYSSRSVLTGDSYRGVDQIGIPSEIAKKITLQERVTPWNFKRLQQLLDSSQCLRYGDGSAAAATFTYSTEEAGRGGGSHSKPRHGSLRIGQVVSRRIKDGDIVFVNRTPTTHKHALQAFSVYVHDDRTVKINPLMCSPFNADFDGDCVHIFYPQSLPAKAEAVELFSVERQLFSSHTGKLNLQLANDSILALKMLFQTFFFKKETAQQLAMFTSPHLLPPPALIQASHGSSPFWTVLQILHDELEPLSCSRESLQLVFTDAVTSLLRYNGPNETLRFVNSLQPLLMEFLFLDGFSVSLSDFHVDFSADTLSSHQSLRSRVEDFILRSSSLGHLIDPKSDSAVNKLVEQIGFLGPQLFLTGKLYSRSLADTMSDHCIRNYHPIQTGNNSFFHGLDPYEELAHSISTRELTVRSMRGLSEPGTLFKNLMAILRDVSICYDGTVRNICTHSIIQFEYDEAEGNSQPGEPVGALAATAVCDPAYKAVLYPRRTTDSSWELMKELLLSRSNFTNDENSRRVILYLEESPSLGKFCKEKTACTVQSFLRKLTLKQCAVDFSIVYESEITDGKKGSHSGLVGHIHLDKDVLTGSNRSALQILQRCQETVNRHRKKRSRFAQLVKTITISASQSCSGHPCVQFTCKLPADSSSSECDLERAIHTMANTIYPILLHTVIRGDPRIHSTSITWINPQYSRRASKGEPAVEVIIEKDAARRNGDAWRIALDCCIPVMRLIDTRRSIPYAIQQLQHLLGISSAIAQLVQRLSTAINAISKGVLKKHLMLVGHSMTCTGSVIGFNTCGYRALFRDLNIQAPLTEATLLAPMKCFERAAEKCDVDTLSSVVGSSVWGKTAAIGTGADFEIVWSQNRNQNNIGMDDVYDFLHAVRSTTGEMNPTTATRCLGEVNVDDLPVEENGELSSNRRAMRSSAPTFDDDHPKRNQVRRHINTGRSRFSQQPTVPKHKSAWKNTSESGSSSRKSVSNAAGVEQIIRSIKRILHKYRDGDRLFAEDERYIMDRVFWYHPDKKSKVSGEINYFMVDRHPRFSGSRCFFVVSSDGSRADFSYNKCMENYVKTSRHVKVAKRFDVNNSASQPSGAPGLALVGRSKRICKPLAKLWEFN